MRVDEILMDKELKPSQKTERISEMLNLKTLKVDELVDFASGMKDPDKATCIEAIEYATKEHPGLATLTCLEFLTQSLTSKSPRVKWESARTIGNIAHLFPEKLNPSIQNLLANTTHPGTVVRWSAAFALGQILKLKTAENLHLLTAIQEIIDKEEKNSIKKNLFGRFKKGQVKTSESIKL